VPSAESPRILLVDHEDSFVHTLAGYFREAGARVVTYRHGQHLGMLDEESPDLVVLSPGPGRPADFGISATLDAALARGLPVFGVCLGLQGMVEYFGGELLTLATPTHGKASRVRRVGDGGRLLAGLPPSFETGRYHSLHADPERLPEELRVTAWSVDGVVMAVEHRELPLAAVQFHPESIMTMAGRRGHQIIGNVLAMARTPRLAGGVV
jgi:anthranilate synthase